MGQGTGGGQPLSDVPELQHLIEHEPWLAGTDVRARAVWECVHIGDDGHGDGQHYPGYLICRRRQNATLLIVMRPGSPRAVYVRRCLTDRYLRK